MGLKEISRVGKYFVLGIMYGGVLWGAFNLGTYTAYKEDLIKESIRFGKEETLKGIEKSLEREKTEFKSNSTIILENLGSVGSKIAETKFKSGKYDLIIEEYSQNKIN